MSGQRGHERSTRQRSLYGDKRTTYRQDETVNLLLTLIEKDDPVFTAVLFEISRLKRIGVELTETIFSNVIAAHRESRARQKILDMGRGEIDEPDPDQPKADALLGHVVYYARIGNRVKIGTTGNLRKRMMHLNPEEVLVTEPGSTRLESQRHREFRDLNTNGEWFKYEGALVEHIKDLRKTWTPWRERQ